MVHFRVEGFVFRIPSRCDGTAVQIADLAASAPTVRVSRRFDLPNGIAVRSTATMPGNVVADLIRAVCKI